MLAVGCPRHVHHVSRKDCCRADYLLIRLGSRHSHHSASGLYPIMLDKAQVVGGCALDTHGAGPDRVGRLCGVLS